MKFKQGDRVVNIKAGRKVFLNWDMPLYTRGVVTEDFDGSLLKITFEFPKYPHQELIPECFDEIEFEEVFNSPLYQALK